MRNTRTGHRWGALMVAAIMMLAAAIAAPAQIFTTLVNFDGTDGAAPYLMSLVQGTDGNLYGTTTQGGNSSTCLAGCGTVFKMSPAGAITTIHSFGGYPSDGALPEAGLALGPDGNLYGTTVAGGTSNSCSADALTGCGTVFKITPSGSANGALQL
jgi:uncharacterized repeat protein (TIGR03803 family)